MTAPRILLVGYYGKANFGDDVLLKVTYSIIRRQAPDAAISILVDGDKGGYLTSMLGSAEVVAPGTRGHFDTIVHGGGGVFFDFAQHGIADRLIERAIGLIGPRNFVRLEHHARAVLNRPRLSADHRIGLGIGVGTFTAGSPKLRHVLPTLQDFDSLWVRDAKSVDNLGRFGLSSEVVLGSDLAFLTEHWCTDLGVDRTKTQCERPKLGVILRDWPSGHGDAFATSIGPALKRLSSRYEITGFVFDESSDPAMTRALEPFPLQVWTPLSKSISDFAGALSEQNVLLSSRAHGAICGACLGVPSVIVEVEPKLRGVHEMLSSSTQIVSLDQIDTWDAAIAQALRASPTVIRADVERNRRLSLEALTETIGRLDEKGEYA